MKSALFGLVAGVLAMVATWFHYRYWADALADTVGYPISLFVTPAFFALAALALTWVMMSYRPTFRRCWLGFTLAFALSYLPLMIWFIAGE